MASSLYGVLRCPSVWGIEESAQELTVRFNIQPATQSSGFSDIQSNEANSSSLQWHFLIFPQSLVVNQHHPLQLRRELQQVDQSRLQSESTVCSKKQGTNDGISYGPGFAKVITLSSCTVELEKKRR
jgi:hypothetical protein